MGIEDMAFALEDRLVAVENGDVAVLRDADANALAERLFRAVDWYAPIEGAVPTARAFNIAFLVSVFHWYRYTRTEEPQDLSRAAFLSLVVYQFAADLVPDPLRSAHQQQGRTHRPLTAAELEGFASHAVALLRQAEHDGAVRSLDDAVAVLLLVIRVAPAGHRLVGAACADLGNVLTRKYEYTGDAHALQRAAHLNARALSLVSRADPHYPVALSNLGHTAIRRFERDGEAEPLRSAIDGLRQAVALAAPGDANGAVYRTNLGAALTLWYRHSGQAAALDEAVEALTGAVAGTAADHPDLPSRLSSLAQLLALRDQMSPADEGDSTDTIISLCRRALSITAEGHPDRPACLLGLAGALHRRFERTGDPADLRVAIDASRSAVGALPEGGPLRPKAHSDLAAGLRLRFRHFGDRAALDEAVELLRTTAAGMPGDLPDRAQLLIQLGGALRDRFTAEGRPADRRLALRSLREAAACRSAPAVSRVTAADAAAELAAEDGDFGTATELYAAALEQLDLAAWRGAERDDQERVLSRFGPLPNDAAACAVQAGQPERAVELLEQGRGILLARALEARADHHALRAEAPALADQLAAVQDALQATPDSWSPVPGQAARTVSDRRADLARRRDALLAEVRSLPGLRDFLRPPPFAALRAAADHGPVVLLNSSRYRCDALVLTRAGVRVLPLPCPASELADRAVAFIQALAAVQALEAGDEGGELKRFEARDTVTDTLGWLWDTVAGPVLDELFPNRVRPDVGWPRLWWCPTGLFTLLPLHAAGHHAVGEGVLDRVVPSYTPTLRTLLHARERLEASSGGPTRRLVVSLPSTPGWPDLPNAEREAAQLLARYPDTESLTGRAAHRAAVLDALSRCSWAHFACHGAQALERPSLGALFLYDRPLTLREIVDLRLDRASFAFLSACDSSRGGLQLANEAISFASALHVAGFRHVVGTLWPINDATAPDVAAAVYDELARDGTDFTAAALHTAIRRMRSRYPRAPLAWAPYVHIGA